MSRAESQSSKTGIESILQERRVFDPPVGFANRARIGSIEEYRRRYAESIRDPEAFWAGEAKELHWFEPWDKVLEWDLPYAKWFVGGKLNAAYNCLDRQVELGRGDKPAIVWEGEPGDTRTLTFSELTREVCRFANVLKGLGVKKGDPVTIYMPMVPELAVAVLACARIGAPHSVIFGGFAPQSIVDRVDDLGSRYVVTADGGRRRGKVVPLKANVDEACARTDTIETVVVLRRCENEISMKEGRDRWWHDLMADASDDCPADPCDAEDLLFVLYTSGTTGKPKGIMHTTGGYLTYVNCTARYVFDLREEDVYWCTADVGWITGHSYVLYGILSNGATSLMYEGAPDQPGPDRFWEIAARHKATVFYTAPTAIRAFMKWGEEHPARHDLSSLRLLGTVGEPINPEAWIWYRRAIGGDRCPIVDTWWQTETGGILITPLPGAIPTKPGSATLPFFGIEPAILRKDGTEVTDPAEGGFLAIRKPWPSMLRGIHGDPERFRKQYWEEIPGVYFAGDGAHKDADGDYWILGRVDDVVNVSGHRLGTAEVESALVAHPAVAEAAVVGYPDPDTGSAIAAFVILTGGHERSDALRDELRRQVADTIGPIARPKKLHFTDAVPKTRSGKIMRRLLREIAEGHEIRGDVTTLEDASVLDRLRGDEG